MRASNHISTGLYETKMVLTMGSSLLLLLHPPVPHILCTVAAFAVIIVVPVWVAVACYTAREVVLEGTVAGEGALADGALPRVGIAAAFFASLVGGSFEGWGLFAPKLLE